MTPTELQAERTEFNETASRPEASTVRRTGAPIVHVSATVSVTRTAAEAVRAFATAAALAHTVMAAKAAANRRRTLEVHQG